MSDVKLNFLQGLGIDVDALKAQLDSAKDTAESQGRESKEKEAVEAEPTQTDEEIKTDDVEETEQPVDADTVESEQDSKAVDELKETISQLTKQVEGLTALFVKSLEDKDLKQAVSTSIVGKAAAIAEKELADSKPKEAKAEIKERTGIPVLDAMLGGSSWRDALEDSIQ